MSIELKVKSKHLSVEARIIRHEENKLKRQIEWKKQNEQDQEAERSQWFSLNEHRRWNVRNENRATFLARAYIAGKAYKNVEQKRKYDRENLFYQNILPRVLTLVKKYSNPNLDLKHITAWVDAD
jgi:hypothetical protein